MIYLHHTHKSSLTLTVLNFMQLEDRDPWPNAATAANWTCVGLCAHRSAEGGGERVDLPAFTLN